MGVLRFLLAMSILVFHAREAQGLFLFSSLASILCFFIISGFYMGLILDGKYKSKITFYTNRFLRIFPLYWTVLFITLLLGITKLLFHVGSSETALTHYFTYSTHLTGIYAFFEGINFLLRNLTLIVTKDYVAMTQNLAPGYLIINQAWTLQIELLFYLVAPFMFLIRRNFIAFVFLYGIIFYGIIEPFNIFSNTLIYSFLSFFIYFCLGICSYRYIYKNIKDINTNKISWALLIFFVLFIVFSKAFPQALQLPETPFPYGLFGFYIPFAIGISFIFKLTKNSRIDRFIGELSYPIYISHMLFAKIIFSFPLPNIQGLNSLLVAVPTILFSICLVKFVQNPIDRFRHNKLNKHRTENLKRKT